MMWYGKISKTNKTNLVIKLGKRKVGNYFKIHVDKGCRFYGFQVVFCSVFRVFSLLFALLNNVVAFEV